MGNTNPCQEYKHNKILDLCPRPPCSSRAPSCSRVDRECGFVIIILCDYFFMVGTHYKKNFLVRSCLEERERNFALMKEGDERSG